jgi:integrin-linked kinase
MVLTDDHPNDIYALVQQGNMFAVRLWLDNVTNDIHERYVFVREVLRMSHRHFHLCSDEHGFTLLHWASWHGSLPIVQLLLERGARINAINRGE